MARPALLLAAALALPACGGPRGDAGSAGAPAAEVGDWGAARRTQQGKYQVALRFEPEPPALGELFTVHATVRFPDGTPVADAEVVADARMPQHDHGMETRPRTRPGPSEDGAYVVDGFKFHMRGRWTVLVDVRGPRGDDNASFVYDLR